MNMEQNTALDSSNSNDENNERHIPIINIHEHLGGATALDVLYALSKENSRTNLKYKEFEKIFLMGPQVDNLGKYLEVYERIEKAQSFASAVELSVYSAFSMHAVSGGTRLELRFNPAKRTMGGQVDMDSIIRAAIRGMNKARDIFDIDTSLAFCLDRSMTFGVNKAIFNKALLYKEDGVDTLDLAGPYFEGKSREEIEQWFRHCEIERFYDTARDNGMDTTVHIGEVVHPTEVDEMQVTMEKTRARRIGHGVRLFAHESTRELIHKTHVFEFCPSSNLQTGLFQTWGEIGEHLFQVRKAAQFVVCTDASVLLGTTIVRERELAYKHLGLAEIGVELQNKIQMQEQ